MSSINQIGESAATPAQKRVQQRPNPTPAQNSSASSALQEANETIETTRQEAAKGDQVAIRKLARMRKNHQTAQTLPSPSNPAKSAPASAVAPGGLNLSA
jgi:hypothetical protein